MCPSFFAPILALVVLLGCIAVVVGQDQSTCNRNGGSKVTWAGTCDERNYTYTEWCNVVDGANGCEVTANACGCKYDAMYETDVHVYVFASQLVSPSDCSGFF